jgi:hypothetical protein
MNRGLLWGIGAALMALTRRAEAYPDRTVHDRNWGLSAQWINFTVPARTGAQERVQIQVATQNSRCRDPLNRDLCNGSTAFIDLFVHVFSEATGQPVTGMARCLGSNRCPTDLTLPAGRYAIFLHGGPLSRGAHELLVRVTRTTGGANVPIAQDSAQLSDNIVLDVRDAPANFDLHSVLVSDGPTDVDEVSGSIRSEGNTINDWIGVDATEAWLFDENFRVLDADLSMSGVGPAALVRRANEVRGVPVRYVLVRPYRRPPFAVRRADGRTIPTNDSEYPSVPGAGRMRVVLNDERDTDGDRLSDQVEFELGLCDGRSAVVRTPGMAFRCMLESEVRGVLSSWRAGMPLRVPSDPRDTDGDGLTDAAEVLGTDVVEARMPTTLGGRPSDAAPYQRLTNASQTLPLWGFDPRHKDLLLEIDRETMSSASCNGVATGCDADRNVYPSTNYTDVGVAFEHLWSWRRAFALLPALRVRNPDGRPGIKMHFDVRFAKVLTRAHGFMPQDVPASTSRGRFGEAGFIIHHPLGDTRSMCSCSDRFMSPDPRHGGMARYMLGRMGGGGAGCNGELDGQVGIPDTVASHEFGHTQGLDHGGPMPSCFANPFARPEATDYTREDKVAFPSHMNYSFDYRINQQSNHDVVRGEVFSVGRNWPLPRSVPTATGSVLGWPELNSYGGMTRTVISR